MACCCSVDLGMTCLTSLLNILYSVTRLPMSLQLWAFSRDNLMPGSKYMRRLDNIWQTPAMASECCSQGFCSTGSLSTSSRTQSLWGQDTADSSNMRVWPDSPAIRLWAMAANIRVSAWPQRQLCRALHTIGQGSSTAKDILQLDLQA